MEGLAKHHTWVVFWKVAFAFDLQKRVEHGWVDDQETKKISHNIWSQEVLMMRAVLTILDQQPYLIDCSNSSKSYQGYPRIKPLAQGKYHWNTLQIPSSSSDKNSRHLHKPKKWPPDWFENRLPPYWKSSFSHMPMDQYLLIPFLGDEHPFTSYFDVHQGYKVLTHCHIESSLEKPFPSMTLLIFKV